MAARDLTHLHLCELPDGESPSGSLEVCLTPSFQKQADMLEKVALSPASTILLEGESGTGKNTVARWIHQKSPRAAHSFVEINCAALPETLFESELFGHERGAFTDAKHLKRGLLEMARRGTLFLDEIIETSLSTQAKLLHVIESGDFRRLGGLTRLVTDARIIAACSRNLRDAVALKQFREDLYFRMQLITIEVPPLRDRPEDIPVLGDFFIRQFNAKYGKSIEGFSREALDVLKDYPWPGNVRELRNMIERVAILEETRTIEPVNLPKEVSRLADPELDYQIPEGGLNPDEFERRMLLQALQKCFGNHTRAARLLGMATPHLRKRMAKLGLVL